MFNFLTKKNKKGKTLPELFLIIALVSMIVFTTFQMLGRNFKDMINYVSQQLAVSSELSQQRSGSS